jgi:hypothetical protein
MTDWDPGFCDRSALYWPIREVARPFASRTSWPQVEEYDAVCGGSMRFERAAPRPRGPRRRRGEAPPSYDASIVERGAVPTRAESWHDLYNALVWAVFPRAKRQLHRRQRELMTLAAEQGIVGRRSPEHDVLAMLDEGGVIALCRAEHRDAVLGALRGEKARDLHVLEEEKALCRIVFGHALYEGLRAGATRVWGMSLVLVTEQLAEEPGGRCRQADGLLEVELAGPIRPKPTYPRLEVPW